VQNRQPKGKSRTVLLFLLFKAQEKTSADTKPL